MHVQFQADTLVVAPGDTFTVELVVTPADAPFNAFDASIRFDPTKLTFVPTTPVADQQGALMTDACSNTFHVFEPAPDSLRVTLSLLCSEVSVTGPGAVYRVRFAAVSASGLTSLSIGPFTRFYLGGVSVDPLELSGAVVQIGSLVGVPQPRPGASGFRMEVPRPNPIRGAGAVTVGFTLPAEDDVRLEVFDAQGRRVAARPARRYAAGRHELTWRPESLPAGRYVMRLSAASGFSAGRPWVLLP